MTVFTYSWLGQNGRLGNCLWQIASTVGRASKHGGRASLRKDWEYRRFFSVPASVFDPTAPGDVTADGGTDYMQRLSEFSHCESTIREYFQPSNLVLELMADLYPDLYECRDFTALHVRRGDYVALKSIFHSLEADYYRRALHRLSELGQLSGRRVIFTDDPDAASSLCGGVSSQHSFEIARPRMAHEYAHVAELFLMSRANSIVIANSTFSWWAAWLSAHNRVIMPDRWSVDSYELQQRVHEFTPSNWTVIPG